MINHKTIKEFREISNPLRKRKDMALDISFQLETGENSIALIKKNDSSNYCLAVIKIRRNSYDILLQKMQSCSISKEQSLKLIKSLEESDVCSSSIKLNFKCPYSLKLIQTPVRGKYCKHPACFDLLMHIQRQEYEEYR